MLTNDGRILLGKLEGFDQTLNIILSSTVERVFSLEAGVESIDLGVYVIRGDNMYIYKCKINARSMVGQVDQKLDDEIIWKDLKASPIVGLLA